MSVSCSGEAVSCSTRPLGEAVLPFEAPVQALREIARRYGTPTYAYDLARVRAQVARLRANLPQEVQILYTLKANASLGLAGFLAECGLGLDVASAGELVLAQEAGFAPERIFVTGPDKSPALRAQLRSVPEAVVSLDSLSELQLLAGEDPPHRALLRLRPDFHCTAVCPAGSDSRFGVVFEDLPRCRDYVASRGIRVVGFHIYAGSQVLDTAAVVDHLRGGLEQSLRAADVLGITPAIIDLGGGFGIPYGPGDRELDLAVIGAELRSLVRRAAPARLVLELGRYLVAQAGWYLTTVLSRQTHGGRRAVVVDGGSHQRADLCGIGLRRRGFAPVLVEGRPSALAPTDVLGCLSLPADVLAEASPLPALAPGDLLAFANAGAYGLVASPWLFHGHPAPAEVAFEGTRIEPLRIRQPIQSILEGQVLLKGVACDEGRLRF
jgi:diaminopimelate decarboxylase